VLSALEQGLTKTRADLDAVKKKQPLFTALIPEST
jgi:hypothetical protein